MLTRLPTHTHIYVYIHILDNIYLYICIPAATCTQKHSPIVHQTDTHKITHTGGWGVGGGARRRQLLEAIGGHPRSRHRWMESGGSSVFNVKFVGPVDNIMPRG